MSWASDVKIARPNSANSAVCTDGQMNLNRPGSSGLKLCQSRYGGGCRARAPSPSPSHGRHGPSHGIHMISSHCELLVTGVQVLQVTVAAGPAGASDSALPVSRRRARSLAAGLPTASSFTQTVTGQCRLSYRDRLRGRLEVRFAEGHTWAARP